MRARIVATVAALVLLALAAAGVVVYVVEAQRLNAQTIDAVDRVLDEFAREVTEADPTTTPDLDTLFSTFLQGEVAEGSQSFVGINSTTRRYFRSDADPVVAAPDFHEHVAGIVESGGSVRYDGPKGPVLVTAQPVTYGGDRGAFLVISNLRDDRSFLSDTIRVYVIVATLSFLLVTGVAWWRSGRLLRPLNAVRRTADEITESDLSRRLPVTGNDDITALTRTFNGMLDRLEAAFTGQRQFLDDAGHELKTPLTVLRGHLELLDVHNAEELDDTRDLLLDEVDRMARLVGDLILLAKTDRPDFLRPDQVELGELTETVLAKARGLGDRHWTLDHTASATVVLDEQRMTQALLQLTDNAVKHTGPGDVVAIGSAVGDGEVTVWVRDTGPGVPPEVRDRIFDRFGRGEVVAGDEGFGLGLSIVAAIAAAHGGRAWLDTDHHDGARFVITLPHDVPDPHPTLES